MCSWAMMLELNGTAITFTASDSTDRWKHQFAAAILSGAMLSLWFTNHTPPASSMMTIRSASMMCALIAIEYVHPASPDHHGQVRK